MTMRISGFVSGLDIDKIVSDLMRARREPLNKLNQQKTIIEWKREQYREITSKIVDFRNNKLFNYGLESNLNSKKVTISGDQGAVTAKALAGASGNMTIKVNDLATAGSAISSVGFSTADRAKTLSELDSFDYTPSDGSDPAHPAGKIYFEINGKEIVLDENSDSINSIVSKINNANAGVTAFVDSVTGKVALTSKSVGDASTIEYEDPTGVLANFGFDFKEGKDASVVINGIETTRPSNTFTENGIEITLNAKSTGTGSTLQVAADTDKIMDTIKSFINDYNEMLSLVNGRLNQERFRTYKPLTAEQKEEMSEKEVELWESKASSGLLRRDSTLSSMVSEFRLSVISSVDYNGSKINLTSLGIGTADYTQQGKLVILNENKLREAIESSPDEVIALFSQRSSNPDSNAAKSPSAADSGIFNRLSNSMMKALEQLSKTAGTSRNSADVTAAFNTDNSMAEELRSLDRRIADMTSRLKTIEINYYKQFTAMETAMNRYSAQATSLFS
ncbi:flagellar filament capping protein FliD [Paenibacillaceae bacterium WGS1546]|uniref:flagellar filament capping protein FliD n=1 Tax=Cohnella sp. WGS1546 TaxID=3366810 RepID=UPI00372D51EB